MPTTIYIGVGSNLDPQRHVLRALSALLATMTVEASSTFYWSAALERPEQARFLNGVWRASTELSPRTIKFEVLRPIEMALGRVREADKHAARTIDLDLLMHGNCTLQESDLTLPDPEIPLRAFLWQPLRELLPEGQAVPGLGLTSRKPSPTLEVANQVTQELRRLLIPSRKTND
ncbi:MAG: 2-amino-4-hydroxy-6-hydroxymethyldihydropteridine diphosphokinase [Candidatus Paceibacteria bacterium]